jgi:uncharacterized protein (TIGR03437 family)
VVNNLPWITINSGASGSGNGTVNYIVAANSDPNQRVGSMVIAGQSFTVTQSGVALQLTNLNPSYAIAGGASFTLTVTGSNFSNDSVVRWNGSSRATSFISSGQLTAIIPAADIATAGTASVTVFTPSGGGTTNSLLFIIANGSVTTTSAASFSPTEVAPESIVAAFGLNLATGVSVSNSVPLPTSLLGTTVKVKDSAGVERLSPIFFVSPGQINYLIPAGTANGAAIVTVTSGDGKISIGTISVVTVVPGIFTANSSGLGVAAAFAVRAKQDGSLTFEPVAQFNAAQGGFVPLPIDLGPPTDQVFLVLYGTGLRFVSSLSAASVTIGGLNSDVLFAGAQGGFVGLDQVNVLLSRNLIGRGEVDVKLVAQGRAANTVKIQIK